MAETGRKPQAFQARYLGMAALVLGFVLLVLLAAPLPPAQAPLATMLYDCHGRPLAALYAENRQPVALKEVPRFFRQAVIATEDAGFYRHFGISPRGIARALWRNLTHGRILEGASTITQQLARNAYLNPRRSIWRKLTEVVYAFKLELWLGKDEILTRYLNQVYFGEGAYGVKTAAQAYFGRAPQALNQAEQAFLVGLLQAPATYSPWRHPEAARRRLNQVIGRMRACGYLTADGARGVLAMPLHFRHAAGRQSRAPYFVGYARGFLASLLPDGAAGVYRAGLQVVTTIDLDWQEAAEAAMRRLDNLGADGPEGCLVALDPRTGAIRAMVGGRDYERSSFNRVTQALRQPGSAFKPIVYADAIEHGYTLAMLRQCEPRAFHLGADTYLPTDAGQPYHLHQLSLRQALASSCNVVAVTLGAELGPPEVAGFARRLGIESPLRPYLSLSLGTSEIHPLELAAVYGTFANGGLRAAPFGVVSVRAADGRLIYRARPSDNRVIRPSTAFLLTQALTDVFGPGGTARGLNPGRPAAGKTGTSDGNRDAWFAGYTPDLTAVVQIGYDQGRRSLPGSGGTLAAPIWSDFVRRALHNTPARAFTQPGSVHTLLVCAETGELATPVCPAKAEFFVGGTEPSTICSRHRTVRMLVCRRSRLLPGLNCKHLETVDFHPGEEPAEICHLCKGGLLDWLDNLFKSPARPRGERNGTAGPVEEHGILAPGGPPEGGERRRGWR